MTKKLKNIAKRPASSAGISQLSMAKHIDVSQQRISQFVQDGTFPALPDGKLDKDVCRIVYVRWLRDETRRSSSSEASKRVQDARAKGIEIRNARELGKLVMIEDVELLLSEVIGTFSLELSGVAAASTRDLNVRAEIQEHLNAAIDRCKASFDRASANIEAGKPIIADEE